jgi:hypothetical protein
MQEAGVYLIGLLDIGIVLQHSMHEQKSEQGTEA